MLTLIALRAKVEGFGETEIGLLGAAYYAGVLCACAAPVYRAEGCLECRQTGFLGRKGIYEMMLLSDDLKQHITDDFDLLRFRKLAIKQGMRPLNLAGAQKVARGITTIQEVLKVAPPRYDG